MLKFDEKRMIGVLTETPKESGWLIKRREAQRSVRQLEIDALDNLIQKAKADEALSLTKDTTGDEKCGIERLGEEGILRETSKDNWELTTLGEKVVDKGYRWHNRRRLLVRAAKITASIVTFLVGLLTLVL